MPENQMITVLSTQSTRSIQMNLTVSGVPEFRDGTPGRYTPDRVRIGYMSEGAGWRIVHAEISGMRYTAGKVRVADAWSAVTINSAPEWLRALVASRMPEDS